MAKDAKKSVTIDQLSAVATKVKTWSKNSFVEDVTLSSGKIQKTINGTTTDVATIPTSLPNPNSLKLQAGGTDKVTYDGSSSATLNIASGSSNGTISVGGTDVSVTGLGSLAYVNSLSASDVSALPSTTMYAGSSTAGGAATSAAKLTNTTKVGDTNQPVYFTANGVPAAISHTIDADVPSNAVFTDTDTKVTSAANHYTPSADNNSELTATIDGTAGSYAINTEYTVLTGVKAQRDAKGHITGITYTAQKVKDTDTTYTSLKNPNSIKINTDSTDVLSYDGSAEKTLTITGGTNKITISDGTTSKDIAITPSISNNTTGSDLTADTIILGNGSSSIKTSGKTIETTLTSNSDDVIPTSKAVATYVGSEVDSKIAAADAMIFKGTIGDTGATITTTTLPNSDAKTGWTYRAIKKGDYTIGTGTDTGTTTVACEIGDMIICLTDGSSSTYATWTVVQNNIDGAVTGPASSTGDHIATFNGTSGKVIKDSGYTIATSVPSGAVFTDTHYTATPVLGDSSATSNATSNTSDPYLNIVENSVKSGGIQIKGSGATSVSAKDGIITISSTDNNTTYSVFSDSADGLAPSTTIGNVTTAESSSSVKYLCSDGKWRPLPAGAWNTGTITSTSHTITINSGKKSDGTTDITATSSSAASPSVTLADSGVTAGSYGDSSAQTPAHSGTFKVPYVTVNAKGVVTGISEHTVTLPASGNTDTSVTSVDNHYTPSANNDSELTATISGTAGTFATNTEYTVLTGVKAQRDAKGHVTGLTYTAQTVKDTTVANTDRYVNSASFADDTTSNSGSPVKMTLTRAGSDSATVTGNIPAVSSSSAGVAPKGAAVSTQNQSTKFLREDGTWAAPSYTTNTNTTYGLSINGSTNGDSNGTSLGTIYAPTTAGTSGYVLTSTGSGAPTWAAASGGGGNIDYTTTTSNIQNIDATIISTALRKTAQTLTAAEKTQVKTNLGITISTSAPTSADGENGDIWLVYEA